MLRRPRRVIAQADGVPGEIDDGAQSPLLVVALDAVVIGVVFPALDALVGGAHQGLGDVGIAHPLPLLAGEAQGAPIGAGNPHGLAEPAALARRVLEDLAVVAMAPVRSQRSDLIAEAVVVAGEGERHRTGSLIVALGLELAAGDHVDRVSQRGLALLGLAEVLGRIELRERIVGRRDHLHGERLGKIGGARTPRLDDIGPHGHPGVEERLGDPGGIGGLGLAAGAYRPTRRADQGEADRLALDRRDPIVVEQPHLQRLGQGALGLDSCSNAPPRSPGCGPPARTSR